LEGDLDHLRTFAEEKEDARGTRHVLWVEKLTTRRERSAGSRKRRSGVRIRIGREEQTYERPAKQQL